MDHSTKSIAEFAARLSYADLPAEVVHDCKRRIIDTIGCAIAAFDEEPSRIARAVAMRARGRGRRLGDRHRAPHAAGAGRLRQQRGEPLSSRATTPIRAAAVIRATVCCRSWRSRRRAAPSAQTAITAIVLAYEVHRYLFRAFPMRKHALDYVLYNAVVQRRRLGQGAGAIAAADRQRHRARGRAQSRHRHQPPRPSHHVEGLRRRQRGAERRVRGDHGEGGHGGAANAVRGRPDRGDRRRGDLPVSGRSQDVQPARAPTTSFSSASFTPRGRRSSRSNCCRRSSSTTSRRSRCSPITSPGSRSAAAPRNGSPTTRETADHSMPYVVAAVLIDGAYTDAIFAPERFRRPAHARADEEDHDHRG